MMYVFTIVLGGCLGYFGAYAHYSWPRRVNRGRFVIKPESSGLVHLEIQSFGEYYLLSHDDAEQLGIALRWGARRAAAKAEQRRQATSSGSDPFGSPPAA